jgi:phytoene dehydrogenase-like protein
VVIVGGGLAGLAAARQLHRAGLDWLLVEGADRLGGRIATDLVDGYRLDRGFQVLNTAYPRLRALVDLDALRMGYFTSGVLVRRNGTLHRLVNPLREPTGALDALHAGIGTLRDRLRLAALAGRCAVESPRRLLADPDLSTELALSQAGLSPRIVEELVRPFLSGVLADRELRTSWHVTAMIMRSFARGRIGVPADGMAALPAAIAAPLPAERIRLSTPVQRVEPGTFSTVHTAAGPIRARLVLVAGDPALAGLPRPPMRSLTTYFHTADEPPIDEPILLLDGDRRERIANSVVLSNAAPSYAPRGKALIATSVVGAPIDERLLRTELTTLYGRQTAGWSLLRVVEVAAALPEALMPQGRLRKPVAVRDGLFVAGDHRDSPSIQGALASGRRAADAMLQSRRLDRIAEPQTGG